MSVVMCHAFYCSSMNAKLEIYHALSIAAPSPMHLDGAVKKVQSTNMTPTVMAGGFRISNGAVLNCYPEYPILHMTRSWGKQCEVKEEATHHLHG